MQPDITTSILFAPDMNTANRLLTALSVSDVLALLEKYVPDATVRLAVITGEVFVDEADAEIARHGGVRKDEYEAACERLNAAMERGAEALWSPDAPAQDRIAALDYALGTPVTVFADQLLYYLAAEIRADPAQRKTGAE